MDEPEHLQRLNPEQRLAVTSTEGPLLILAGAGSGKTRVLTRRIAHLLYTGVSPRNILAVTFTNKAAAEMKERVAELIGEPASTVWVSTFHSTCCRILRTDIEPLGFTRRFAIYDDDDQLRLLRTLVDQQGYDKDRVQPRAVMGQIDHYKSRMLGPDEVVAQRRSHINDPLHRVWRDYEEALRAADALDFNDLIGRTVQLFTEHPAVLSKWRERFCNVLVDEYQDTNRGQYEFLRLLAAEHRNLAVVGDDDQSIYGFRGADVTNILNFEKDYPEATVVRLEQNYRSTANILSAANAVVAKNSGRLEKKLWTQAPPGPKVHVVACDTPRDEAQRVARAILKVRRQGIPLADIAIIYRTNAMSRPFESALRALSIPHRIVGGRKFYARREIRDTLAYLRLIVNPADDAAFLRVVNVPTRGVGAKTLAALREEATTRGMPLLRTARSRGASKKSRGAEGLAAFVAIVDELSERAREVEPAVLVGELLARSGYRAMLEGDTTAKGDVTVDARGRLDNLDELARDAASFRGHGHAAAGIDLLTSWLDRIALTADADDVPDGGEVTLMTVHSSKGLEYPVVFVVQMNEGQFPHARSLDTGIDEERRLAYVAFTRAMKRLVVTRSQRSASVQSGRLHTEPATASRFLFGIPTDACEGDLPGADPAEQPSRALDDLGKRKLRAFVRQRTTRAPPPKTEHTLVDIERADQLHRGVRVHHARHGVGEVRFVQGARVQVAFEGGRRTWLPMGGPDLQLLLEEP